ncbi:uncharacterized protein LOC131162505 [Malania oleifera]|uniref:uncharacterized protein LOC131162505 n=1 Tax=Malania oleifera TaxID=397392 RepID=UPI0025AE1380|nr:uncharacterized protein LOC131162505 [Malania oleifera]
MNEGQYREEGGGERCGLHPGEVVVGVCPLCLKERLLVLAAKKGHTVLPKAFLAYKRSPIIPLPNFFAFLHRLEFRHRKSDEDSAVNGGDHDDDVSTSPEDSFISIKFEDNGVASWERSCTDDCSKKVTVEHINGRTGSVLSKEAGAGAATANKNNNSNKSVIEHAKRPVGSLRWRKRVGHLFQLMRWKRTQKAAAGSVCRVGSRVEGVKVMRNKKKSWIRTLTRRRTQE